MNAHDVNAGTWTSQELATADGAGWAVTCTYKIVQGSEIPRAQAVREFSEGSRTSKQLSKGFNSTFKSPSTPWSRKKMLLLQDHVLGKMLSRRAGVFSLA